jgi:hypothetical protein
MPLHPDPRRQTGAHADGDFSLVLGGPLYRLMARARLLRPPLELLHRRMLLVTAVCWLPLLVLGLAEAGSRGAVRVPFLFDIETHARFLVALPVLVWSELLVHVRLQEVVQQFRVRAIIPTAALADFQAVIDRTMRLRDSMAVELALLVLVFTVGPWTWQSAQALLTQTWYASADAGQVQLSRAGWWLVHVSVPLFQFLLLRWYFRLLVWWRFLWQVSRLPLDLRASHPDRSGGLGFLGDTATGFAALLFAQGVLLSGMIASRIWFDGRSALEFRGEIVVLVIVMVAMILGPLLFFTAAMAQARRAGLRRYGAFASAFVHEFDRKWIDGAAPTEPVVGSPDVSSLADLGGSVAVVREMKVVPVERWTVLQLVAATALPFLPLVFTVLPLTELVNRVFQALL